MFAYLEGIAGGAELEDAVNNTNKQLNLTEEYLINSKQETFTFIAYSFYTHSYTDFPHIT